MASLDLYTPIRAMPHGLSKEGGGGSPHLFPSQSMMGLSLIGLFPPMGPFDFSIKTTARLLVVNMVMVEYPWNLFGQKLVKAEWWKVLQKQKGMLIMK